jgi:hypothetical protein
MVGGLVICALKQMTPVRRIDYARPRAVTHDESRPESGASLERNRGDSTAARRRSHARHLSVRSRRRGFPSR